MSKTQINTHELTEADFRKIQDLLEKRFNKTYSTDYIRKVCKKRRTNSAIFDLSQRYLKIKLEMEHRIEKLILQQHSNDPS